MIIDYISNWKMWQAMNNLTHMLTCVRKNADLVKDICGQHIKHVLLCCLLLIGLNEVSHGASCAQIIKKCPIIIITQILRAKSTLNQVL